MYHLGDLLPLKRKICLFYFWGFDGSWYWGTNLGLDSKGFLFRTLLSSTDAALACPPCCPCVCHVTRPGLELRWVPMGGYEDALRVPCRASPLRTSRSRANPQSTNHPPVVLTSYRSTAERKPLPPLKPPKPVRVKQDAPLLGDAPPLDLELPSEGGNQAGTGSGEGSLWAGAGGGMAGLLLPT